MNSSPVREFGRQAGIGLVLITFVALVTFMFSFLGTILCAALFGMMVGFSKKWKWQFVLISLLFPALLLASLYFSNSESVMSLKGSLGLAAVCFATFWATYLATCGLFLLEGGTHTCSAAAGEGRRELRNRREPEPSWHDLHIEELQGAWQQEIAPTSGQTTRKVIEVNDNELTMSLVGEDGEMRILAKGELQILKLAHAWTRTQKPQA